MSADLLNQLNINQQMQGGPGDMNLWLFGGRTDELMGMKDLSAGEPVGVSDLGTLSSSAVGAGPVGVSSGIEP